MNFIKSGVFPLPSLLVFKGRILFSIDGLLLLLLMQVYYLLSFHLEGIPQSEQSEIVLSLLSGLVKGGVTERFLYHLPNTVTFVSGLSPEQVASILDRINNEVFPPDRIMRYFLAEVNDQTVHRNTNSQEEEAFDREIVKR